MPSKSREKRFACARTVTVPTEEGVYDSQLTCDWRTEARWSEPAGPNGAADTRNVSCSALVCLFRVKSPSSCTNPPTRNRVSVPGMVCTLASSAFASCASAPPPTTAAQSSAADTPDEANATKNATIPERARVSARAASVNCNEETWVERRMHAFVSAAILTLGLTLGAAASAQTGEREIRSGVIEQITDVQMPSNHHRGIGAVVGGLAGLGIGSLIGRGTGRDVAMVLGTLGGAVTGNEIQKKRDQPEQGQQIIVRVTSGVLVMVTQPVDSRLQPGQAVYIEGSGDGARVIPR